MTRQKCASGIHGPEAKKEAHPEGWTSLAAHGHRKTVGHNVTEQASPEHNSTAGAGCQAPRHGSNAAPESRPPGATKLQPGAHGARFSLDGGATMGERRRAAACSRTRAPGEPQAQRSGGRSPLNRPRAFSLPRRGRENGKRDGGSVRPQSGRDDAQCGKHRTAPKPTAPARIGRCGQNGPPSGAPVPRWVGRTLLRCGGAAARPPGAQKHPHARSMHLVGQSAGD